MPRRRVPVDGMTSVGSNYLWTPTWSWIPQPHASTWAWPLPLRVEVINGWPHINQGCVKGSLQKYVMLKMAIFDVTLGHVWLHPPP